MENIPHQNFNDWFFNIIPKSKDNRLEQICVISYHIWKARNTLIFKQDIPIWEILERASHNVFEYQHHLEKNPNHDKPNKASSSNESNWKPPPTGTLKTNVDAHCLGDGRWGLGWLVRNEEGRCLGAETRVVCAREAVEAEVMGLEAAIQSLSLVPNQINIVETDAKMVVDAIQRHSYPRSYWRKRAKKVGMFLKHNTQVSVRWVRRTGNRVAHHLASWAAIEPNKFWSHNIPIHIVNHIQKDMIPSH
jgi:ribonuclease HI